MKRKSFLMIITLFVMLMPYSYAQMSEDVKDNVYGGYFNGSEKQNSNFFTEVFDNGDGTYSYYLSSKTNFDQTGLNYPAILDEDAVGKIYAYDDDFSYVGDISESMFSSTSIEVSDEVEVISAEVVDFPVGNGGGQDESTADVQAVDGKTVISWNRDISVPMNYLLLAKKDGFLPQFNFINVFPTQTLKIVFKPKDTIVGNVLPLEKVYGEFTKEGETIGESIFLRSILIAEPKDLEITTTFYDKDFNGEIDQTAEGKNSIGVQYVITNTTGRNLKEVIFSQDQTVTDVTKDGAVLKESLAPNEEIKLGTLNNGESITLQAIIERDFTSEKFVNVATASYSYNLSTNILPTTHQLGSDDYIRYKTEDLIDDETIFPPLENATSPDAPEIYRERIFGYTETGNISYDTDYVYWTTNHLEEKLKSVTAQDELKVVANIVLSFESNGGTDVDSQELAKGDHGFEPQDPTKDGYKFLGWYESKKLEKLFDFSTSLFEDTTVYAKWEKIVVENPDKDEPGIKENPKNDKTVIKEKEKPIKKEKNTLPNTGQAENTLYTIAGALLLLSGVYTAKRWKFNNK